MAQVSGTGLMVGFSGVPGLWVGPAVVAAVLLGLLVLVGWLYI